MLADLRETTEVQLVAEITNTADSLFGLSGQQDTTVLDQDVSTTSTWWAILLTVGNDGQ